MAQGIVEGGDVWYGEHRLQEGQLEIRISRNRHLRLFIGVEKSLVLLLGESACDSILFSGLNLEINFRYFLICFNHFEKFTFYQCHKLNHVMINVINWLLFFVLCNKRIALFMYFG